MPSLLIIDDDLPTLHAFSRMLGLEYEITRSASAEDAVELVALGKRYDLVLCDLELGQGISGLGFFNQMRAKSPWQAARILFFTGSAPVDFPPALLGRVLLKTLPIGNIRHELRSHLMPHDEAA